MQLDITTSPILSFVEANIEVGQSKPGLNKSAHHFLTYLTKTNKEKLFIIDENNRVESQIANQKRKILEKEDFTKIDFAAYKKLADINTQIIQQGDCPLNFGGDHSLAMSTVEASLRKNRSTHVIWIDAHADLNSAEESMTGSLHGMPVYYLMMNRKNRPQELNWMHTSLHPAQITYIGLRDIDPFEKKVLEDLHIDYFTAEDIKNKGQQHIIEKLNYKNQLFEKIHLSFDIDSLDPSYGLCTGVPAINGLKFSDALQIFQLVQQTNKLVNFDLVEINPQLARNDQQLQNIYSIAYQLVKTIRPRYSIYSPNYNYKETHDYILN